MRTLDYIKLDSAAAAKVVESLQQLLADYQVFYANFGKLLLVPYIKDFGRITQF